MQDMSFVHFEAVARAFTALDIARPLIRVPPDTPMSYGLPRGPVGYPHDWCWLVADDERVYGYVTEEIMDEEDAAACIGDLAEPFGLRHLVSGSMPLLDLVPRLAEEDSWTLFVLTEQGITHVVTGEEYNSVPVRLCLFALLSELEAEMIHALVSRPDLLAQRLGYVPEQQRNDLLRRADHDSTWMGLHNADTTRLLRAVNWANLVNKERMLSGDPFSRNLFGFEDPQQAEEFLDLARRVRNKVAHGQHLDEASFELLTPQGFAQFVENLRRAISLFAEERRADERYGRGTSNS